MDLIEIISDAIVYPFHNIRALAIFAVIGIIGGILAGASLVGMFAGVIGNNALATGGFGFIGILIGIICSLLISGYTLDIVKFGIEGRYDAPGLNLGRQIANAIKLIIVGLVYYITPAILGWALLTLLGRGTLTLAIVLILAVVFSFSELMAKCRLAIYEDLGAAISIGEALGDVFNVGFIKIILTLIAVFVIGIIIAAILSAALSYNDLIGRILLGIFGVYFTFFYNRAIGLLYSSA